MLHGLIVDLVPFDARFQALSHSWENGPAAFWGDMGDRQFHTQGAIRRMLDEVVGKDARDPSPHAFWGIQAKDGTPIGLFVNAELGVHHRCIALGAMIGEPDYWGGGYGTDALLLAVEYAFAWHDARRVFLMTMALNERVVRQMARIGFTLEHRRRHGTWVDGAWVDGLVFGLLREEWPGREALIEQHGFRAKWGVSG